MSKENSIELAAETAEFLIDRAIQDEILREIPIVGAVIKICQISKSVHDYFYLKMLTRMLNSLSEVTDHEKEKFRTFISENKEDAIRGCEKILICLKNISDIEKAEMIANVLIAYLDEQIESKELKRCVDIISNTFVDDISNFFKKATTGLNTIEDLSRSNLDTLINTPLFENTRMSINEQIRMGIRDAEESQKFEITDTGRTLLHAFKYGMRKRKEDQSRQT